MIEHRTYQRAQDMLTVHADSHVDHVSQDVLQAILERFSNIDNQDRKVIIESFELPAECLPVDCGLYGPIMGDGRIPEELAEYKTRGERTWTSRTVFAPMRKTRIITIIAGPYAGNDFVLYTCYGGPVAPKELNDPNLKDHEYDEAKEFWSDHALADQGSR